MTHRLDIPTLNNLVDEAFNDCVENKGLRFGQAMWNVLPFFCIDYLVEQGIDFYHWTDDQTDEIVGLVYEHLSEY